MNLKIGSRIFLKKSLYIKLVDVDEPDKSSLAFGIVAITDYAINLKNLRTGKTYTISLGELQGNVDETSENPQTRPLPTKKAVMTLNSPINKTSPAKLKSDFNYEIHPTNLRFTSNTKTVVIRSGDPFAYLYDT